MQTKILLLHGALGSAKQMMPLAQSLEPEFDVSVLNFRGHSGDGTLGEFTMEAFSNDIQTWIEKNKAENINILGYSMGGYAALYLAKKQPDLIGRIFTIATKFNWTIESAEKEVKMLDAEAIKLKVPAFAETLKLRHHPANWEEVCRNTAKMMISLGKNPSLTDNDFSAIRIPVKLGIGENDRMVSLEETQYVHRLIPGSMLKVFPETQHPVEKLPLDLVKAEALDFFQKNDDD